jgi:hypothetical protein
MQHTQVQRIERELRHTKKAILSQLNRQGEEESCLERRVKKERGSIGRKREGNKGKSRKEREGCSQLPCFSFSS